MRRHPTIQPWRRWAWLQVLVVLVGTVTALGWAAPAAQALGSNAIVSGFGSNTFGGNDDGTYPCVGPDDGTPEGCDPTTVPLPFTINYFGTNYNALYLNNNGNVTFDSPLSDFTPFDLNSTSRVIIAAYFADIDTRVGNTVTFGTGTVDGHQAWGANWPGVGCYDSNDNTLNYFQMLLIDRSDVAAGDFDIEFNYDQVHWDSGQASDGDANCLNGSSARVGYSNGNGSSFELPGSAVDGGFLDSNATTGLVNHDLNSNHLGRYVFNVRAGQPTAPTTTATTLHHGSTASANVTVPSGTAVTDVAKVSGSAASTAGGTVTYTVYSNNTCTTSVANAGTKTVTNGSGAASNSVSLTTPGKYYWQAAYSGDNANNGSLSSCGSEVETVQGGSPPPPADHAAPTCSVTNTSIVNGKTTITILVSDHGGSGVAKLDNLRLTNATWSFGSATSHTYSPAVNSTTLTASRVNQAKHGIIGFDMHDAAGNVARC